MYRYHIQQPYVFSPSKATYWKQAEHRNQHSADYEIAIAKKQDVRRDVLRDPRYVCYLDSSGRRTCVLSRSVSRVSTTSWPISMTYYVLNVNSVCHDSRLVCLYFSEIMTRAADCMMSALKVSIDYIPSNAS